MKLRYAGGAAVLVCLAGCAGVYDQAAVPVAGQARSLAYEQCNARRAANELKTYSEMTECVLGAEMGFAHAIKLNDMALYDTYAARLRLAAAQSDAGTITKDQLVERAKAISADYYASIEQAAAIDAQKRAQISAALAAAGESMQREADRQAYIQAHNRPVNCTSTAFANQVNTTCN